MGDRSGEANESQRPVHTVTVDDFFISKYEVTFEQYDKYCDEFEIDKPHDQNWGRGKRPVILVTWDDAVQFCESIGARLPTEAEWEFAAKGGNFSNGYL